jgi:O-antigen/teichoic acid export membrane protein
MSRSRNRRVLSAATMGLAQRAAQLVTSLVTLPLVLHTLGVAAFGIWAASASLAWGAGLLDLGLGGALITLLPRSLAVEDARAVRDYIGAALIGGMGIAGVMLVGGGAAVWLYMSQAVSGPILVAVAGLALNVPLGIAQNAWFGLQKGFWAGFWELVQTVLTLALLLLAVALHGGVLEMAGAVYSALVLANVGSLVQLFWRHPEIRPGWRSAGWRGAVRGLPVVMRQGNLLFGISLAGSCSYLFDNLLTLHWLGVAASARMAIMLRLSVAAAGMIAVVTQPLWPAFVEAAVWHDRRWASRSLVSASVAVAALALGGAATIIMFGGAVLRLWLHADIGVGPGLLWASGAWIVVLSITRVVGLLFNAFSILRFQLFTAMLMLAVAVALKFWLARRFGAAGILASTAVAGLLVTWPAYAWRLWHWVNMPVLAVPVREET